VVLPGLDTILDTPTWEQIGSEDGDAAHGHPQFGMQALLRRIVFARRGRVLGAPASHGARCWVRGAPSRGRKRAVAERLTSGDFTAHAEAAFKDIAVANRNAEEEALFDCHCAARGNGDARQDRGAVTPDPSIGAPRTGRWLRWNVRWTIPAAMRVSDTPSACSHGLWRGAIEGLQR